MQLNSSKENQKTQLSVQETIDWLLRLGRPPLPECPIEAAKQGKEPKQPQFFDGKRVIPISWKQWQHNQPIEEIWRAWFKHPKTGIGTLGGWNGKHWLAWVDFDAKDFDSGDACDAAIAHWREVYPQLHNTPWFRSPSGGYRFLIAFSSEPENFKANNGFTLSSDGGTSCGELLTKNGGHTLLPPTIGINGKPYEWGYWCEYPIIEASPEAIGLYSLKAKERSEGTAQASKSATLQSNSELDKVVEKVKQAFGDLPADRAFEWHEHNFKQSADGTNKGNCPWHDSKSGTSFYVDHKNGEWLWRCPHCSIGGGILEYRHRLTGGNGFPRGKEFVELVQELAREVNVDSSAIAQQQPKAKYTQSSPKQFVEPRPEKVNLYDKVKELLSRNLPKSQFTDEILKLSTAVGRSTRDILNLANAIREEFEIEDNREDIKAELEQLLTVRDRRLSLSNYLHGHLANPLDKLAEWMGVDVEALLTLLLPTAASLMHPQSRVIVKECIDFVEPFILYTGMVTESGNRKSPALKAVTKALKALQTQEDERYEEAVADYEEQIEAYNKAKKNGEEVQPPEKPRPVREYFVDNITGEALDRIKAKQPNHGLLIKKDELSGLFASYNSYRGGKGSDKEGILSGWNGDGIKINRASGSRISLANDSTSIVGAIQPDKLRRLMGDFEDSQGEWARFLWYLGPLRSYELPENDSRFEVGELLRCAYRKIDNLEPQQYRFAPDAQRYYQDWYKKIDRMKLAESRSGLRAAIAKMPGNAARIAGVLHVLWEIFEGNEPSEYIPLARVQAGCKLTEFYMNQVLLIHAQGKELENDSDSLAAKFAKIMALKDRGSVKIRDIQNLWSGKYKPKADTVREWLKELEAMGKGVIVTKGRSVSFEFVEPGKRRPQKKSAVKHEVNQDFEDFVETADTVEIDNSSNSENCSNIATQQQTSASTVSTMSTTAQKPVDSTNSAVGEVSAPTAPQCESVTQASSTMSIDETDIADCIEFIRAVIANQDPEFIQDIKDILTDVCSQYENPDQIRREIWNRLTADERSQISELFKSVNSYQ